MKDYKILLRNNFIIILHKRLNEICFQSKVKKRIINNLLKCVEDLSLFDPLIVVDEEDDPLSKVRNKESWQDIEDIANIIFSQIPHSEKENYIRSRNSNPLRTKIDLANADAICFKELGAEERILSKQKELGIDPALTKQLGKKRKKIYPQGKYGRTPLHEAVIDKDIKKIRKYCEEGKYISYVDNNNHTPLQMALYDGFTEGIDIIRKYL